jgi:hypothetical protein
MRLDGRTFEAVTAALGELAPDSAHDEGRLVECFG